MTTLRTIGLALLFVAGILVALIVSIYIFFRSLHRKGRAFHKWGSVCRAEITALDERGTRFAGVARVRFSTSTAEENSPDPSIIGMAIKIEDQQDIVVATFESFMKVDEATKNTDVADYMKNEYGSVAPWRVPGLGPIWFRAIPNPDSTAAIKTGTRTERLDADIAANRASFVIEVRERPFADGKVLARVAELRLLERAPDDDSTFHISMFHTGRGIKPTGFRNGLRAVVYPVSQFARGLRGA